MLLQINIKNFALIEELSLNFHEGFNVFTGETGAGKSILIDAINYVLGSKFNKDLIRTGESSTYVEAIFGIETENTKNVLSEAEIEYDDVVIISRESFSSGRSNIKVNGKSVILSSLRQISEVLIDIHGQHENVNLLHSSSHINYLDSYCSDKLTLLQNDYKENYNKLLDLNSKIKNLQGNDGSKEKIVSYLQFQLDEINNSRLTIGEDVELEEKAETLTNSEKITSILNDSYEILYNGVEGCNSVYDGIENVIKELRSIENKVKVTKKIADSLEEAYYNIEQNISELRTIKDSYYYDIDELSTINSRIYEIGKLKKKYGDSIEKILQYRDKLQEEYEQNINGAEIIKKLNEEKNKKEEICFKIGDAIHNVRIEFAEILEKKIMSELGYIGMGKSIFKVEVKKEGILKASGTDKVQFLISTNPGEPLKALEKIASGGELSRIMLSLKTVFLNKDSIPTVIFDEIDTGISGAIAQRVAEKMYLISSKHQVFCITHLSQIATMSDIHYRVYKDVRDGKTYTSVKRLTNDEKIEEVSRMIGGIEVTDITINNAKQIIQMADDLKKNILKNI